MLKIRLMRIGAKKKPFYRVVAVDERNKRTGAYIELLGTYNPLTEPKDIKLKQDRIDHWIKQGAQMSDGFLRIIGKAPQRPPRKPKKEKKVEQPAATSQQPAEEKTEEAAPEQPTPEQPAIEKPAEEAVTAEESAETPAEPQVEEENEQVPSGGGKDKGSA